jgi:hypothetical protein
MIEKLKISKSVYWITLVLLANSIVSVFTFIYPDLSLFEIPFGIVIYCLYISPILIFLLLLDYILNKNTNKKRLIFSFVVNILVTILAYYYLSHLYDNLWV